MNLVSTTGWELNQIKADKMQTRWKPILVISLALAGLTVFVYWPSLSCDFVDLDDGEYVTANGPIQQGISIYGWLYAWSANVAANWHPMTLLSLELDSTLWGQNPLGFHQTNLIFHTLNVVLLYVVLWQMTQSVFRSACVAALFALHPLHVESVAWVSERKDVLSTFFLLLTMMSYVHYARRPTLLRYLPVMVLLALGLLSKPMLVTTPILLCLLDFWPLNRIILVDRTCSEQQFPPQSIGMIVLEKVPLLFLSLVDGIITILAQTEAFGAIEKLTLTGRIANVFNSYCWYLQKTLVPTQLVVLYPHPGDRVPLVPVVIGVLLVAAITLWALLRRRRQPFLLVGWAWFLISLLPVIGLLQVGFQAYADRYSYIPHIGLFISIVWGIDYWLSQIKSGRVLGGVALLATLVAFGWLTHLQIGYWKSTRALWTHALEVDPDNPHANLSLAGDLFDQNNDAETNERVVQLSEKGLRLFPTKRQAGPYSIWGNALAALDRNEEAEEKFKQALEINPQHLPTLDSLWKLMHKLNRRDEGSQLANKIIFAMTEDSKRKPYCAVSQMNLGEIEMGRGNAQKAMGYFDRAVKLSPKNPEARNHLAMAQFRLKQYPAAKSNFARAIQLSPEMAVAHAGLAEVLRMENDLEGAKQHLIEALRIAPNNEEFKKRLEQLTEKHQL